MAVSESASSLPSPSQPPKTPPDGWEQPVVAPFLLKTRPEGKSVAIIGSYIGGLNMPGKVSRELFFPIFNYVLAPVNAHVAPYETLDDFLSANTADFAGVAIHIYREETDDLDAVEEGQRRILAKHPGALIVHPVKLGRILGSKADTNAYLAEHGLPVPRMIDQRVSNEIAFSNHAHSTKQKVYLVRPGEVLDSERYNTTFIDTTHRFNGVDYYAYIRAYAVGEVRVATYVGCRPVAEGNPSVHLSNGKDPVAINYFNCVFAIPFQEEIERLCRRMGALYGLGFYIHDFLPCRNTGRLFIAESGFKLGPGPAVKRKFWTMRNEIPPFSGFFSAEHILRACHAFVYGAQRQGFLKP
jgi:hypothetical protein